jgi:hypothetical protein
VGNATRREYQRNPQKFDLWVEANTVFGSVLAIGMLAMALAGLNAAGPPDAATELSSVTASFAVPTAEGKAVKNPPAQKFHDMSLFFPGDD